MNGIFPFQVEVNTLFSEKGHIYMLIGYVQSKKLTGQVLQKTKGFAFRKILHILFIGIGLTFKTNVLIGAVTIQVKYGAEQPFRNIPKVKQQYQ